MADRPVLIIDGLNVFTRHFVANPAMSDKGYPIGALVGFLKGLRLLSEKVLPSQVIVVWEGGGSARRRSIFPDYKQGRRPARLNRFYDDIPDTYQNRDDQLQLIIESLKHVPVVQMYVADCEADDVLGYLVSHRLRDQRCVMVSSDKDLYQLVDSRSILWSPGQKIFVTPAVILEKFGIHPNNFCTARCFVGDPSDGLPGVKGAGFKTLAKRFEELRGSDSVSVEDIIQRATELSKDHNLKVYNNIVESADIARRNWKLMFLGVNNLSGTQIQKIDGVLNTFAPSRNKIALMRLLLREGVQNFDVDSYYMAMNTVRS